MPHSTKIILVETTAGIDVLDITEKVQTVVADGDIKNGQLCVFIGGSTGSITTIEHEPGVIEDFLQTLEKIAPKDAEYEHNKAWQDGNAYSHILAAMLGPSTVFPIEDGRIPLGTWQQIVLVDLHNKGRQRKVMLNMIGE